MIDLKDKLTILIAAKIDHDDRLRNLRITLDYLQHHFNLNVVVSEQDEIPKLKPICDELNCKHKFIPVQSDETFNRQRGVNIAAREAKTPVIALYDTDVLLQPEQIIDSVETIISGTAQMVYPYDGYFYDIPVHSFNTIKETKDLTKIRGTCQLRHRESVGGVVMFDREHFWKCGGANENFSGWGYEDNEFLERFRKFETKIERIDGPALHLKHQIITTDIWHSESNKQKNFNLFNQIKYMNLQQLTEHIKSWDWMR